MKKSVRTEVTFENAGSHNDVVATLKIRMTIGEWREMAEEAIAKLGPEDIKHYRGNYYAMLLASPIDEILAAGQKKYIEFHDENAATRERWARTAATLD